MCQRYFAETPSANLLEKRNLTAILLILIPEYSQLNANLSINLYFYFYGSKYFINRVCLGFKYFIDSLLVIM